MAPSPKISILNGTISNYNTCTGAVVILVKVHYGLPVVTLSWVDTTNSTTLFSGSDLTYGTGTGFVACCEVRFTELLVDLLGLEKDVGLARKFCY